LTDSMRGFAALRWTADRAWSAPLPHLHFAGVTLAKGSAGRWDVDRPSVIVHGPVASLKLFSVVRLTAMAGFADAIGRANQATFRASAPALATTSTLTDQW